MSGVSLNEGRAVVCSARAAQRRRLLEELYELARYYVANEGNDPRLGMELMCEDFFRHVATEVYPDGWSGLLSRAIRQAG